MGMKEPLPIPEILALIKELEAGRAKTLAADERLRRVELEVAALRQLIETQASLLSSLWADAQVPTRGVRK